jgi:hypothetical protein
MLIVETIAKVRRAYFLQKRPIKAICREFRLSRKVVRKVIRSEAQNFVMSGTDRRSRRSARGAIGSTGCCWRTNKGRRANG